MNDRYKKSNELIERALQSIPLASQTFSKSILQFPRGTSPLFITHGKGSHVWDVDGNEYIDFVSGLLSVAIGYNDPEITGDVIKQLGKGVTFSLPHPLEMEVAELLIELVPCAEKVRFGKNGSDATSAAVRLARAYTGREHILVCGYHGWQDWYIGSTSRGLGVPTAVKELTHAFKYNDINDLKNYFVKYQNNIAAVIMEPMNIEWPNDGYLEKVKEITADNGAILIFDETITGFRFAKGGAQELFGVIPDIATLGKGMSNGFPLSAVVGKEYIMNLMEDIFFSGTFGGETLSLAAAKTVLKKVKESDFIEYIYNRGKDVLDGVNELIQKHDVAGFIEINGHPSWSILTFKNVGDYTSHQVKTFFLQEMFKQGILTIGSHNITYSHSNNDVLSLLTAYMKVLPDLRQAISENTLAERLEAKVLEPVFKVR